MPYKKSFSNADKKEYKQKKQDEIEDALERINEGVQKVFQSDQYRNYLRFMSKFHDYSVNNAILICLQKPNASLVAGYSAWQDKFNRQVSKGEKAIKILAPIKCTTTLEKEKINPVTQRPELGADGKPVTEQKEVSFMRFKLVNVFDVSQTTGEPIPRLIESELSGEVHPILKNSILSSLETAANTKLEFEDMLGSSKGYYSHALDKIAIKSGMPDMQTLKTAFHEVAHCLLHDPKKGLDTADSSRAEKELQAESVAYIVADHFNMDTSEYSFPYLASWSHGEQPIDKLKSVLNEIQNASNTIITHIEDDLQKNRVMQKVQDDKAIQKILTQLENAKPVIDLSGSRSR